MFKNIDGSTRRPHTSNTSRHTRNTSIGALVRDVLERHPFSAEVAASSMTEVVQQTLSTRAHFSVHSKEAIYQANVPEGEIETYRQTATDRHAERKGKGKQQTQRKPFYHTAKKKHPTPTIPFGRYARKAIFPAKQNTQQSSSTPLRSTSKTRHVQRRNRS